MLQSLPQSTRLALATFALVLIAPQPGSACPPWQNAGSAVGELEHDAIDEASGLASSRRHPGHFWTHNDSGGNARIYLLDDKGNHAGLLTLEGIEAKDWEDIAVAPCTPRANASCIYVADIGDNGEKRPSVSITRVREPKLPDERPAEWSSDEASSVEFQYPDGPLNAETLLVHPTTTTMYVLEKTIADTSTVFRIPRAFDDNGPSKAESIAEIEVAQTIGGLITGGAISPEGREFSVRTYVKIFTFCAKDGESFESAFDAEPVTSHPRFTFQSEALAYGHDGKSLWFTSEGQGSALVRMRRVE